MTQIGILICARYLDCAGGKCFRALRERQGGFAGYPRDEPVELVGYTSCGGCPGGNVEHAPEEMINNGATVIHLATGLIVGYPPCPYIRDFKQFIETQFELTVVVGTHPIPLKYLETHQRLPFWDEMNMEEIAGDLLREDRLVMKAYN